LISYSEERAHIFLISLPSFLSVEQMSSSIDAELIALVDKMWEKRPPNTRLTADACLNAIRRRFPDKYTEVTDWDSKRKMLEAHIEKLQAPPAPAPAKPAPKAKAESSSDDDDSDDDDDDDDDSDDDDDDEEEEDDEEGSDSDGSGSEEEDDESFEGDSDDSDEEDSEGEDEDKPKAKKQRTEKEKEGISAEGGVANEAVAPAPAAESTADRIGSMTWFLRKLHHNVPKPLPGQSDEDYINTVLTPKFTQLKLDPSDCSKEALKRYKIRKELEALQQEVDINLDPRTRRGRYNNNPAAAAPVFKPSFVDDD
jgi:hypothetical protein